MRGGDHETPMEDSLLSGLRDPRRWKLIPDKFPLKLECSRVMDTTLPSASRSNVPSLESSRVSAAGE